MASDLIASNRYRAVVGLGASGLATARYLHARGEPFVVLDTRPEPPALAALRREMPTVTVFAGELPQTVLDGAFELIVSPGLALELPFLQAATAAGAALCGDVDLFLEAAGAPVVGITGTNAKSTVTALVGAMAEAAGRRVAVGGNLGTPALDLLADDRDLYVLELSSFQLERSRSLGLAVACVLNLTPDHLDRHGSMVRYHQAKHRIFHGCARAVVHSDDPLTIPPQRSDLDVLPWRLREPDLHGFGLRREAGVEQLAHGFDCLLPTAALAMPGRHNVANALAALAIGTAAGLPRAAMVDTLRRFRGLPHRCEVVAEVQGVRWINDSKATNVSATKAALSGLGGDGRLLLIAGGRGKGEDLAALRAPVSAHCAAVFTIGESAAALAEALGEDVPVTGCGTLAAAVAAAAAAAGPGDTVLLSPACASFDQFADFEARGEAFRTAVQRLGGGA